MIDQTELGGGPRMDIPHEHARTEAWRQAHFASQAAAELGKGWAVEKSDDSHSSFAWVQRSGEGGLEGVAAVGEDAPRTRLVFAPLELSLITEAGEPLASIGLGGMTVEAATGWVRSEAARHIGPPRQNTRPAPDLPDHPLNERAPLNADTPGLAGLASMYAATDALLERLRGAHSAFEPARCWPHHFDLASLAVVGRDAEGAMTQTVGVGITPPDSLESAGYWYVSPWSKNGLSGSPEYPRLAHGRWVERGGGVSMAVLSVDEAGSADAPHAALADFVAGAVGACRRALGV